MNYDFDNFQNHLKEFEVYFFGLKPILNEDNIKRLFFVSSIIS